MKVNKSKLYGVKFEDGTVIWTKSKDHREELLEVCLKKGSKVVRVEK